MQLQSDAAGRAAAAAPGGERTMSELLEMGQTTVAASRGRVYMTGDLRALTGLSRTHMDFYLREGIVQPTARTGSGYLLFDDAELETLRVVLRWREEGVGIREIRDRLGRPAGH
jgi:hypothetical protein